MSSLPPTRQGQTAQRRSDGIVVPNAPRWHQRLAACLIWLLLRGLAATLRYKWIDRSGYYSNTGLAGRDAGAPSLKKISPAEMPALPGGPVIFCVWHNRLALTMRAYYGYARKHSRTPGMAAMVSASKDGALLAAILECFKVQPVRGSSSRRGKQALLELTTWAERGYDLAITPDGPRGPCYVVQHGVMSLAQISGLPIIPFSFRVDWKLRPKSWDRFQIPLPFSRCEMIFEKPVRIPREASESEREELRQKLERTLREISRD